MSDDIDRCIEQIATAIRTLVSRLRFAGFQFHHPESVIPGVEVDTESSIERIEREIGRVPYAVASFWRRIGSVDLTGSHPDWIGCEYPDSLVILPASVAVAELDDFLLDREERLAADFPYLIPIAPDDYHKEDVSGGMWYNVDCPATSDNPIVNDEGHNLPFLEYLRMTLLWGGFPGLEQSRWHDWPVQMLAADLLPTS